MRRLLFAIFASIIVTHPALAAPNKAAPKKPAAAKKAPAKPPDLAKYAVTFPWDIPSRIVSLVGKDTGSQEWQNFMAAQDGLVKLVNRRIYEGLKAAGKLVKLPDSLRYHAKFDLYWAWVYPWTAKFAEDMNTAFLEAFGKRLQANSASRDIPKQKSIAGKNGRKNPNAAATEGPKASSHLYAGTIDIGKLPMSSYELAAMRIALLDLEERGLIEVTEEEHQAVFHIMVFKKYLDQPVTINLAPY